MAINWNPIASGLNFFNNNDQRLLVGDQGTGSGIDKTNSSSYVNQIINEVNRKHGSPLALLTSNDRLTINLLTTLQTRINIIRASYYQSTFNFTTDLTSTNIHAALVEMRQALNTPKRNAVFSSADRIIVDFPYGTFFFQTDSPSGRVGKYGSGAGATSRQRRLSYVSLQTNSNVFFVFTASSLTIDPNLNPNTTLEPFTLQFFTADNFDSGSLILSLAHTDIVGGQPYIVNLGSMSNAGILMATYEEYNTLGLDPGLFPAGLASGFNFLGFDTTLQLEVIEDEF